MHASYDTAYRLLFALQMCKIYYPAPIFVYIMMNDDIKSAKESGREERENALEESCRKELLENDDRFERRRIC